MEGEARVPSLLLYILYTNDRRSPDNKRDVIDSVNVSLLCEQEAGEDWVSWFVASQRLKKPWAEPVADSPSPGTPGQDC